MSYRLKVWHQDFHGAPVDANGNISDYVKKHRAANRLGLLVGVTRGLSYLHEHEVVHGDWSNILIDARGNPRRFGFGLCSATKHIEPADAQALREGWTIRYHAPELLDLGRFISDARRKPTNESDMYYLSMVIVELATGEILFPDHGDPAVVVMISKGSGHRNRAVLKPLG